MNLMRSPDLLKNTLATAVTPILWGSTYLVAGELFAAAGPLTIATIRTLPAGILLLVATRAWNPEMAWHRLIVLSALNIAGVPGLTLPAGRHADGGSP